MSSCHGVNMSPHFLHIFFKTSYNTYSTLRLSPAFRQGCALEVQRQQKGQPKLDYNNSARRKSTLPCLHVSPSEPCKHPSDTNRGTYLCYPPHSKPPQLHSHLFYPTPDLSAKAAGPSAGAPLAHRPPRSHSSPTSTARW